MKLHCLGTAGYHPSNHRHTSCYFIPEIGVVFDAGTGFYRIGEYLQTDSLEILLSHAHLDHIVGITFLLDLFAHTQLKKATIYGERAKLDAIQRHLFSELIFPVMPPVEWKALEDLPPDFRLGGARLTWFPLVHPGGSVGYRLDWETTSMAYVTDTTATETSLFWQEVFGCRTLLHECNFTDEYHEFAVKTGHSCTTQVVQGAVGAKVEHLLLVHMNPLVTGDDPVAVAQHAAELRDTLRITTAIDGMVLELDEPRVSG